MNIIVNDEPRQVSEDYTAERLIRALELTGKRLAMEVNREIVPRSAFAAHRFRDGDRIEIVRAIGGG